MAIDEKLAARVRAQLSGQLVEEKKMFGGLCFMVNGHMCCGVESGRIVLRVGPEQYDDVLSCKHASPMDFTGRALKGFVYVESSGFRTDAILKRWLTLALEFVATLPAKGKPKSKSKGALKTPIADAMNLGPVTSRELTTVGIKTVEQLKKLGWESAFRTLAAKYPERINLNMATGLIGASMDLDWRKLPLRLKAEARALET